MRRAAPPGGAAAAAAVSAATGGGGGGGGGGMLTLAPLAARASPRARCPLHGQRRFAKGRSGSGRPTSNYGFSGMRWFQLAVPRWIPNRDMQPRSDEWKRRALRNHFPETWLRAADWAPSLEHYRVDPEFLWAYYQQAHRQLLYNHPDDYTSFVEEVLEHVELHPEIWVPRCLRVMEDLKQRYGASQRHMNAYIQVYGRARLLEKAEDAFAEIGRRKLPYCKDNYLSMARVYILCRHQIGEGRAVTECKRLYDEAMRKQIFLPPHISSISFDIFYESLKRLGSELDRMERKEQHARGEGPMQNWDNKTLWHNIKPYPRVPREYMLAAHPLNKVDAFKVEFKGVKPGDAYYNQEWLQYGYPSQVRWIEQWRAWRKKGGWKPWDHEAFRQKQWPQAPKAEA